MIELPIYNDPVIDRVFNDPARFVMLRKGRRVGATRSKANSWIEKSLTDSSEQKFLWVDTVQRNIDRYYERFFWKPLRNIPKTLWEWNGQRKTLKIHNSLIDFGSAERPENLEGFGYDDIFMNEAGIILQGDSGRKLWEESLRPMLADTGGRALFAGVPKGLRNNYFAHLWTSTQGRENWSHHTLTSYDSPYVTEDEVRAMEQDMHPATARQEIYAEFVDYASTEMPWLFNFTDDHISEDAKFNPSLPVVASFDFNIDPMVVTLHHCWFNGSGHHWHTFDEITLPNGSVPGAVARLKQIFTGVQLSMIEVTGDATGEERDINRIDHISSWAIIQRDLHVSPKRMKVPKSNPSVESNRELCNFILYGHKDVKVNPKCKTLIYELKFTEADSGGGIAKKNRAKLEQRADALDTWRYVANAYLGDFIQKPGKYG